MTLVLHYAARSDRGLVRSINQDSVYAGPRLLALADGMGGHAAGEVASKVVIAAMAPLDDQDPGEDLLGKLRESAVAGNNAISELVSSDPELEGMGTTLTAVLFAGHRLGLVHIGDSRAYLFRDGELGRITHDDTFIQSLIDEGRITEEEAATHPQRSLLLRALTGNEVEPSLTIREVRAGDRYMLCSDGLTGPVSEDVIAETLRISDPQESADKLIELALKGGGPDNVTVIVADVVDVDFNDDAPVVGAAGYDDPNTQTATIPAASPSPPPAQQQQQRFEPIAPQTEAITRRRRWWRPALTVAGVLVLLGGSAVLGRWWLANQYFVGVNDARNVAIFQGLQGDVVGMTLHKQIEDSCPPGSAADCVPISVDDLQQAKRPEVLQGITSLNSREDARNAIWRLRTTALLPPCPEPEPEQPPSSQQQNPPPNGQQEQHQPVPDGQQQEQPPPQSQNQQQVPPQNESAAPTSTGIPSPNPQHNGTVAPSDTAESNPSEPPVSTQEQTPGVTCRTVS